MIVVDTNVIASLLLPGPLTHAARRLLMAQPRWLAPLLWRSELRNVLSTSMRVHGLDLHRAREIQREAEDLMRQGEYEADSDLVLELSAQSGCTAYDCEFVAVAKNLGLRLATLDRRLLTAFPAIAVALPEVP